MPDEKSPPIFSVLIPLESHRGLAIECVEAWARKQTFPRDLFQIIISAPEGRSLRRLKGLLSPADILIRGESEHDISLVAEAVPAATGQYLFLTEAHCLPHPEALQKASDFLREHPELSGFSGRSVPITHNLLSEIEADMYVEDIARNLDSHEWLKVLDQCFVVKADALHLAGGIEPEFGHFAEWVLAARLYEKGLKIGVAEEVIVQHRYSGSIPELVEFTRDFARGEFRFASRGLSDPCTRLFPEIPRLENRHQANPGLIKFELKALRHLFFEEPCRFGRESELTEVLVAKLKYLSSSFLEGSFLIAKLRGSQLLAWFWLQLKRRNLSRKWFLKLISAAVEIGYLDALSECHDSIKSSTLPRSGTWLSGWPDCLPLSGFGMVEDWKNRLFQWSQPVASATFRLSSGSYWLSVHWLPVRPLNRKEELLAFLDGESVDPSRLERSQHSFRVSIELEREREVALTWICPQFHAPNETRKLGLPIHEIHWSERRRQLSDGTCEEGNSLSENSRAERNVETAW